jgi:quinoprotein glucose dehydrogenase
MRRFKAALVAVVMCSAVQSAQEPSGPATPKLREAVVASGGERTTWTDFGGGPDNARYLTLDKINKSNLQQLGVAWSYPTRDNISYVFNPVVVDNVMYVLARNNSLVALDGSTGKEI